MDDLKQMGTSAANAVGNAVGGVADAGKQFIQKGKDELATITKNAGVTPKAQPVQAKPDPMPQQPGQVMKKLDTLKLSTKPGDPPQDVKAYYLYMLVKYKAGAGEAQKLMKLGKAADQKTPNFKPGEKLESGVAVQPGTDSELYNSLSTSAAGNVAHNKMPTAKTDTQTISQGNVKQWKDLSHDEKMKHYTDEDVAKAKKGISDLMKRDAGFKKQLGAALDLANNHNDFEMWEEILMMALDATSNNKGEQGYIAQLKQGEVKTGATATRQSGQNAGSTATVDMGSGMGTTATLGDPSMGGVA